jgi:hypothetical protein
LANIVSLVPFLAALVGPLFLKSTMTWGMVALLGGFLVAGQAMAVSSRLLDRRFRGSKPEKGGVFQAWTEGWSEGLVMAALLIGMFSLVFNSIPFYLSQGTAFSVFSLVTLGAGSLLVLGGLPYYLPVRRREGLGLIAAAARSFRLMNARPGLALTGLGLGVIAFLSNVGTLGFFPGFAGLAALHQGMYDEVVGAMG